MLFVSALICLVFGEVWCSVSGGIHDLFHSPSIQSNKCSTPSKISLWFGLCLLYCNPLSFTFSMRLSHEFLLLSSLFLCLSSPLFAIIFFYALYAAFWCVSTIICCLICVHYAVFFSLLLLMLLLLLFLMISLCSYIFVIWCVFDTRLVRAERVPYVFIIRIEYSLPCFKWAIISKTAHMS